MGSEVEATWNRALKVWWSLAWRAGLYLFLITFFLGFMVGISGGTWTPTHNAVTQVVVGTPVGIWVIWWVMRNVIYSDFRIAFVAVDPTPSDGEE